MNHSIEMGSGSYSDVKKSNEADNETNETGHCSSRMESELKDYDYEVEGRMLHERSKEMHVAQ
jgi:N-acetyl-anhydromuramyl-L-alanine amidase AmpD